MLQNQYALEPNYLCMQLLSRTRRLHRLHNPTMTHSTPFPFLRLPKELRLMVYDFLPIRITHVFFRSWIDQKWSSTLTLVVKTIPGLALLTTCKLIHSEAFPILHRKMLAVQRSPVQIIMNEQWFSGGHAFFDGLDDIMSESITSDASALQRATGNDRFLFQFLRHVHFNRLIRNAERRPGFPDGPWVHDGIAGPEIHVAVEKHTPDHKGHTGDGCDVCYCNINYFVERFIARTLKGGKGAYVVVRPVLEEGEGPCKWMSEPVRVEGFENPWDVVKGEDMQAEEFAKMWEVGDGLGI
jgi:hypothetical protein